MNKEKPKKKMFELQENESIHECLDRMKLEGYHAVKRIEKPIFQEVENDGKMEYTPIDRQIVFEGRLTEK